MNAPTIRHAIDFAKINNICMEDAVTILLKKKTDPNKQDFINTPIIKRDYITVKEAMKLCH